MSDNRKWKDWDDIRKDLLTSEEIAESNFRITMVGEIIKAREEKGIG